MKIDMPGPPHMETDQFLARASLERPKNAGFEESKDLFCVVFERYRLWTQKTCVRIPDLPLTCCVTLQKVPSSPRARLTQRTYVVPAHL